MARSRATMALAQALLDQLKAEEEEEERGSRLRPSLTAAAGATAAPAQMEIGIGPTEAAKVIGISIDTFYGLIDKDEIAHYRIPSVKGKGGRELIRVLPSEIVAFRKKKKVS